MTGEEDQPDLLKDEASIQDAIFGVSKSLLSSLCSTDSYTVQYASRSCLNLRHCFRYLLCRTSVLLIL